MRAVLRDPQLAEQLVEEPTIVSYSWLQLRLKQNVDIPVPGRGRRSSGLQGFLPGQGSTALLSSGERISERIVEEIVDTPGGRLQDFRLGLSSSSSSHVPAGIPEALDEPGEGGFRTLSQNKKSAKSGSRSSQRVPASFCPSTPAPQQRVRLMQWVMIMNEHGLYFWNMEALADGRGLPTSLVVARWPVRRPWRQLTMVTWLWVLASWLSDGLSWCRLQVESAWSSVLSRTRVARRPLVRMAVWLYGGLTEGYSSVSALGSTVDTCSATVGF